MEHIFIIMYNIICNIYKFSIILFLYSIKYTSYKVTCMYVYIYIYTLSVDIILIIVM